VPLPSAAAIHQQWQALQRPRGSERHEAAKRLVRKSLLEQVPADLPAVVLLSANKLTAMRLRTKESLIGWVKRTALAVPSAHLRRQNRAKPAAHGELQTVRAGAGAIKDVFTGTGNRTRDSDFVSASVQLASQHGLSAERAGAAVSFAPCT